MFQAYGGGEMDFSIMRAKLWKYCTEAEDLVSANVQDKFLYATIHADEELYLYALRLEQLFIKAYPGQNPSESHELRARFMHSIPEQIKKELEKEFYLMKAIAGTPKKPWASLVTLLRHRHEYEKKTASTTTPATSKETEEKTPVVWCSSSPMSYASVTGTNPRVTPTKPAVRSKSAVQQPPGNGRSRPYRPAPHYQNIRPRTPSRSRDDLCDFCSIPGHYFRNCRRRLNLCLRCGSDKHHIPTCPLPQRKFSSRHPGAPGSQSPRSTPPFRKNSGDSSQQPESLNY